MVRMVTGTTVPTVAESIAGANFRGPPSNRLLFIIASTPLDKARMFRENHFALSLTPGALLDQPVAATSQVVRGEILQSHLTRPLATAERRTSAAQRRRPPSSETSQDAANGGNNPTASAAAAYVTAATSWAWAAPSASTDPT